MRCIELLNEEHHLVLRLVKVVKAIGRDVAHKEVLDSEDMQRIITLFDTFVNSSHELKEESALFPTLIERAGTEAQEASRPPAKPPAMVINRPKVLTTLAISDLLKPRSW